jgi:hypothetical protein
MLHAITLVSALLLAPPVDGRVAALNGLDPVELCEGRETRGQESIDLAHGRFRYVFATAESRARFEKDPARYRIQLGGGCGRMGPLSGTGSPSRYAVHDGRIYVFASDGCRKGFLADPESHLEKDDPTPTGTDAERAKGRALVEKAARAAGGAAAIDSLRAYRESRRRDVKSGGEEYVSETVLLFQFPGRVRAETAWDESRWANVVSGGAGFMEGSDGRVPMDESQVAALRHETLHHPIAILAARNREDFVAVAGGSLGSGADAGLEAVTVAFDGTATTLGIDPATGRIVRTAYRGRAGASPFGAIEVVYSEFSEYAPKSAPGRRLTLPAHREVTFGGKAVDSMSGKFEIELDPEIDPALFAR